MAVYRYNVVVDVSINTSGAKAGSAQAKGAFSMIEADAAKASSNVQGHINAIDAATNKSTKSMGMWGTAFKGAFIGAVAGIAFSTLVSGITGIADATFQAGKNAVIAAAQYQDTTNAMKVFTGSVGAAKAELADIDALARNTVGLRMADAEAGAIQLRGLGFAAKTAQDLLAGLAKQRTLNPAIDDAAVAKVIRNITQLSEGSPRAGQDIREMIAQMPTLNRIINDTFGSQQRFQALLKTDSKDAIKQFTEALANTEGAAGGLNNAFGKLEDAWMSAGRAFGEPLLEPLMRDFGSLTDFLYANMSTWRSWGQSVADAVAGASDAVRGLAAITGNPNDKNKAIEASGFGKHTGNLDIGVADLLIPGYGLARLTGKRDRIQRERAEAKIAQDRFNAENNFGGNVTYTMGDSYVDLSDRNAQKQKAMTRDQEEERNSLLKTYRDNDLENLKQSFANKQRAADVAHRYSTADEFKYQKTLIGIKKQEINAEMALQKQFFDQKRANSDGSLKQMMEIGLEENRVMATLGAAKRAEELAAEKLQSDRLAQLALERRRDLTELNNLDLRGSKQRLDAQLFDVEQMVALTGRGYDELIDISRESMNETTRVISANLALQLEDASLTAQQRVNLEKQANLDIQDAAEAHYQKISGITDRYFAEQKANIEERSQFSSQSMQATEGVFGQMMNLFAPSINFGRGTPVTSLMRGLGDPSKQILGTMAEISSGTKTFYDGQERMMKSIHTLQMSQIDSQIDATQDLIDLETNRAKAIYRNQLAQREARNDSLLSQRGQILAQNPNADLSQSDNLIRMNQVEIDKLKTNIEAIEKGTVKVETAETRRLTRTKELQIQQKGILGINQDIEKSQLKQTLSLDAIKANIDDIRNGKRDNIILQIQELDLTRQLEQVVIADQVQRVTMGDATLIQMMRQIELQKAITELRGQELNAIFRIDRAQLEINQKLVYSKAQADASVAEFLAGQKGITEIISDVKINMLTTAYSGLDAVAARLTRSFGMFRDVVKDLLANLLKLALNSLFQKMGFAGFGGQSGSSSGGFSIPGLGGRGGNQGSGGFSMPGFGGFGSGGGIGGTPNWGGGQFFGGSTGNAWGLGGLSSTGLGGSPMFGGGMAEQGIGGQGGLLGAGSSAASGGAAGGMGGMLSGLAAAAPFLGFGLGSSMFKDSRAGSILGGLGGAAAGIGVAGLLAPAALSGMLGTGVLATAAISVIGLAIAPLLFLGAFFLNRNARRKKEEKLRNQAMLDAFAAIDKLIADVNSDKIDGASALAQADTIRANYISEMSKLKDKKTRTHALADVSRIDSKIALLKSAVGNQTARRDRLELMVPTFAAGGNVNPVGYQTGSNQMGYFPSAGTWASYNERGNEYIFDAETTRNIGVSTLDSIRSNKGRSFGEMRQKMPSRNYAVGGNVSSPMPIGGNTSGTASSSGPIKLEISLNVGLAESDFVQVVDATVRNNDGSTEQLEAIVAGLKKAGQHQLASVINKQIKAINGQ